MVATPRLYVMSDKVQHILAELEAIAASISDPATREEVQEIIARLSHQNPEWPDDAELMRLRLKCNGEPN
jgi:hypothetical protein